MAMAGQTLWNPLHDLMATTQATSLVTAFQLNASAEKFAMVFRVPKTGTLHKATSRLGTVTVADDLKVSLQDVDATTGAPNGTPDQYRTISSGSLSSNSFIQTGIITNNGSDGGIARSVTIDQVLACVFEFNSYVSGDLNFEGVALTESRNGGRGSSYINHYTSAWAKDITCAPMLTLEYSDGSVEIVEGAYPPMAFGTTAFNSGSGSTRYGNYFTLAVPMRCCGLWASGDMDGDFDLKLYAADGSTVLGSGSFDKDNRATTGYTVHRCRFANVDLAAATAYRVAVVPTSGTSDTFPYFDVRAQLELDALGGGQVMYSTAYSGSWAQTVTRRYLCGILVNGFDDAAGGSSGGGPLVGGRLAH